MEDPLWLVLSKMYVKMSLSCEASRMARECNDLPSVPTVVSIDVPIDLITDESSSTFSESETDSSRDSLEYWSLLVILEEVAEVVWKERKVLVEEGRGSCAGVIDV